MKSSSVNIDNSTSFSILAQDIRRLEERCFCSEDSTHNSYSWSYQNIVSALEHNNFILMIDSKGIVKNIPFTPHFVSCIPSLGYILGRYCQAESWVELLRLGVDPAFRQQGLAKKLLLGLELFIEKYLNEVRRILLELSSNNHAALALYQSCHYKKVGQRKAYFSGKSDALLMEKVL